MTKLKNYFGETVEQCAVRLLRSYKTHKIAIRMARYARNQMTVSRPFYSDVVSYLKAKQR
jgi:hypothetical protein